MAACGRERRRGHDLPSPPPWPARPQVQMQPPASVVFGRGSTGGCCRCERQGRVQWTSATRRPRRGTAAGLRGGVVVFGVQGIRFVPTLILIPRVQVCCAGQGRNACVDMLILGAMWSLLDRLRPPPLGWNWKDAGCWRRRRVQEGGR